VALGNETAGDLLEGGQRQWPEHRHAAQQLELAVPNDRASVGVPDEMCGTEYEPESP
jgi:hypothetical protein